MKFIFFYKLKFKYYLKPYIWSLKKELQRDSIIEIQLSDKQRDILNRLKVSRQANEWNSLLSEIEKHNKDLNYLHSEFDNFSFDNIINNPASITSDIIEIYSKNISILNQYKHKSKGNVVWEKQLSTIVSDYKTIQEQYLLYNKSIEIKNHIYSGYINKVKEKELTEELESLYNKIKEFNHLYYTFDLNTRIHDIIEKNNNDWIKAEIKDSIFDNVNGKSLDKEQRTAILKDEKSNLIIAGAGAGKTLTICGKVKYLLERKNLSPNDILLLSYSKKSADDLQKKISNINPNITVGTFHKIGLQILTSITKKNFIVEDQFNAIIESYFRDELPKDFKMLKLVFEYYALFLVHDNYKDKKYENDGDLYSDLKIEDFTTLKSELNLNAKNSYSYETLKKEKVKSYEEYVIANWYFINGIDYVYEEPYAVNLATNDHRQYKPDFFLKKYNIYHEHYGINKNFEATQYSKERAKEYVEGIKWKRKVHSLYKTKYFETYSYEFSDGTIFEKLKENLKKYGIQTHPISNIEIKNALNSIYHGRKFASFIRLIKSFINLYKARYTDESQFDKFNLSSTNSFKKIRSSRFLKIAKSVYCYYINWIRKNNKIDFDDMILQSTELLNSTTNFKYSYIIVDEFQDISWSRMQFLKKLIDHGNSQLFAAGDDWQSIYRFTGSDINIFTNFKSYFDDSQISFVTMTHRNSQELQDIMHDFICKNHSQIDKHMKSNIHTNTPIKVMYYSTNKRTAFLNIIKEISSISNRANILVLGRNNNDIDTIKETNKILLKRDKENDDSYKIIVKEYPYLNIKYSTVHKSKGLEEDYVVLINADDGLIGFPNRMDDDPILNLVLSSKENYPFSEERRLWYVALTRAKLCTYIIANNTHTSLFLTEILQKCSIMNKKEQIKEQDIIYCPRCKTGNLSEKSYPDGNSYWKCSNYPYCDYTIRDKEALRKKHICPICGDYMVYRYSYNYKFYDCHNYPYCKHTERINPSNKNKQS